MQKIAILSPLFHMCRGGEYTAVVLCEALNENGIIPDIYAFSDPKSLVLNRFNKHIKYNFKRILPVPEFFLKLRSYFIILAHLLLKDIRGYNFVYNMFGYEVPFGIKNYGKYLLYCHYPYYLDQYSKQFKSSSFLRKMYVAPILILNWFMKKNIGENKVFLCANSNFTKGVLRKYFSNSRIDVVYPPVNIQAFKNKLKKRKRVISLGGFDFDKKQLLQISLAALNIDYDFYICGQITNKSYFKKVLMRSANIKNVFISANLPFNELKKLLQTSRFFIHTKEEEHFGISIVEAITAGCIPLVYNSGGQKEIVIFDELRFNNENELISRFNYLSKQYESIKEKYLTKLLLHIKNFDESVFKEKMLSYLTLSKY